MHTSGRNPAQVSAYVKLVDAGYGLAMLGINWACICLGCGLTLRLKQVSSGLARPHAEPVLAAHAHGLGLDPLLEPDAPHARTASELERALLAAEDRRETERSETERRSRPSHADDDAPRDPPEEGVIMPSVGPLS